MSVKSTVKKTVTKAKRALGIKGPKKRKPAKRARKARKTSRKRR